MTEAQAKLEFEALLKVARKSMILYHLLMEPRGVYRERNGWGTQDSARVRYDVAQELDLSEERYRDRAYQPPFEQLPWKDELANDNASGTR